MPLYTVAEAFDDIAADPLVFLGAGAWFGNSSIPACAYRNARVIVVYHYCTGKEQPALGIEVVSPTRGRLLIYAEATGAVSTLPRAKYFAFRVEVQPVIPDVPIALTVTYPELDAWQERRYNADAGGCWNGDGDDCSAELKPRFAAWLPATQEFLATPPEAFFKLAKDLHARAVRDSRRPLWKRPE